MRSALSLPLQSTGQDHLQGSYSLSRSRCPGWTRGARASFLLLAWAESSPEQRGGTATIMKTIVSRQSRVWRQKSKVESERWESGKTSTLSAPCTLHVISLDVGPGPERMTTNHFCFPIITQSIRHESIHAFASLVILYAADIVRQCLID